MVFHETTQIFLELLETAGCTISGKSTDTDGYAPAPCTVSHVKGNRVLSTRSCIFSEPNQNNEKHIVEATGTTLEFTKNEYIIMIEAMCLKFTKEQYFEFCHKLIDIVEKPPLEHDFGRFYWS
ncbi:hypothetical protein [Kiloniella sp.]|uniref:hypothetical protein n=1 Tax=Kiloniella sp. TaxID=1938587 RepID=UPI003B029431